jgi:DNA-binding NarL/FixJ family response regulator
MITDFILDDHYMVVEGIRSLLANERDIELIGSASTIASCRAFLKNKIPDIILMDINLPDGNGIDMCKEVKQDYPGVQILAISTFNQTSFIKDMMNNGASGYVLKNVSQKELTEAIHLAAAGEVYMAFDVAKTLHAAQISSPAKIVIGRREKEVLLLISDGLTNGEIAEKLSLSVNTIDTYRKSLLLKLNAKNSVELVKLALLHKLISFE